MPSQERIEVSMVHADDLCEDEPGSELLYLLGYEWTLPLHVNAAGISNATRLNTMDAHGV
jgi:hypothetical protein